MLDIKKRSRTRNKVRCTCRNCNKNWVNPRTKNKHLMHQNITTNPIIENDPMIESSRRSFAELSRTFINKEFYTEDQENISQSENSNEDHENMSQSENSIEDQEITSRTEDLAVLSLKRRKRNRNTFQEYDIQLQNENDDDNADEELNQDDSNDNEEDYEETDKETKETDDANYGNESDTSDHNESNNFEDYSPPNYDFPENFNDMQNIDEDWIIVFILRFQTRFRLSDTAIDTLIKFVKHVLKILDCNNQFENFPTSLYTARKKLGLKHQFVTFSVCPSCHKLHNVKDVKQHTIQEQKVIKQCDHIRFPNNHCLSLQKCNAPLSEQKEQGDGKVVNVPSLIYPMSNIKDQLLHMYQRPDFEKTLKLWVNRNIEEEILCDIYDGEIWKNFSNSGEVHDEEEISNEQKFFNEEHADDHLGIMINVDWFQPFERTVHSSGAIYGAICNLPRELRFKPENMLILGLMPGPNEASLQQINHYLAPIVNQFQSFWEGVILDRTFEHLSGRLIKCTVIACCCDIPAARKLCGHYSANVCCHRCLKVAKNKNFGGMDDIDEWFIVKDVDEHREAALEWRKCKNNEARKRHARKTHARWSEMLCLPYFDPIRFLPVDPMHNLFIGIAYLIVKRLWLGHGKITLDDLTKIQKHMNNIHPPSEIGRISHKIDVGEGFSNLTANEWKNFFLIYARVVLWDFLDREDRKILIHFSQACSILVRRIVTLDNLNVAHEHLIELIRLIEINYGKNLITPNLHLSLHLNECCKDYGPLYSFWCFSFERMNGILGWYLQSYF